MLLRTYYSATLLLSLIFALIDVGAAAETNSLAPRAASNVDDLVAKSMARQELVGVAVGIVENGKVAYLKGYGFADREKQVPVTAETVFNWASNSKPVAAVAAMQLVERGKLDLDADVRKYVPEFPDKEAVITTRQLLCHQSGIPHYSNGRVIASQHKRLTTEAWLDPIVGISRFDKSPLLFTPGEKTSYSSYAYVLLSAVIQRAGNQSFVEQVQERIAQPLEMASMQLDLPHEHQANWATGYTNENRHRIEVTPEEAHYWKHGAGAYKSNVRDFARWAAGLSNYRLMSVETEKAMFTLQPASSGAKVEYGLGVKLNDDSGLQVSHGGKQDETTTHLIVYPEEKVGVVVMTNCSYGKPAEIAAEIAGVIRATNNANQ